MASSALVWVAVLLLLLMAETWGAGPVADRASKRIAESSSAFTVDLIRTVMWQSPGNALLSPLSVTAMLAMVAQGAAGNSSTQLENALRANAYDLRDGFGAIISSLKNRKTKSEMEIGTCVFASADFQLQPKFREVLYQYFSAGVDSVDFKESNEAAIQINRWVNTATHHRIPSIIHRDNIGRGTDLILVNGVYFKGVWQRTFNVNKTHTLPFSITPTTYVNAPFMHQTGRFRAGEDTNLGAKWVELPFDGDEYSMVLVLPTERMGLDNVLSRMTAQDLTNMLNTRTTQHVILDIPRFRMMTSISLVNALQNLGINDIFNSNSDLSGISTSKKPLSVSDIFHKAYMEVNEEGSSASAITAVLVNTLSLQPVPDDFQFLADHPFLAILLDRVNSLPLFTARISNPLLV